MAGDRPDRVEEGRADAAIDHHAIEFGQMPIFLLRHVRDQRRLGVRGAEDRKLTGVDAGGAIFAGLIHPDHRGDIDARIAGAPGGAARL